MNNLLLKLNVWKLGTPLVGGRKWYQYIDFGNGITTESFVKERGKTRTLKFINFLKNFNISKEDRILDIGSNSGRFCLEVSPRCHDVIGVEIDPGFHNQALFVKNQLQTSTQQFDNIQYFNFNLIDNLDLISDRTIIFASKVLYHKNLGDGLHKLMKKIQESNVHTILLQGHTTQGEIGQNDGMNELMDKYGFTFSIVEDHEEYPVAMAKRKIA